MELLRQGEKYYLNSNPFNKIHVHSQLYKGINNKKKKIYQHPTVLVASLIDLFTDTATILN